MKSQNTVTKSNYLNEARYRLTAFEQKLILSVVSKMKPDDEDFEIYKLTTKEFIDILGTDSQSVYSDLKRVSKGLLQKTLEITVPERNSVLFCNWFSSAEYFHNKGYMEFCFDPKLKPYLLKLKDYFVSYKLSNIAKLKSFYSIRIYELLKQFEKLKKRSFELDQLKYILGLEADEYKEYKNFKLRVLEPARKELSKYSDITFEYEEIKESRRVKSLKFNIVKIEMTKNKALESSSDTAKHEQKCKELMSIVKKEEQGKDDIVNIINESLLKNDPECVGRNIKYANKHSKKNYKVFLMKALESDWGKELLEEEKQKEKAQAELFDKQELKAKEDQHREDIESFIEENKEELEKEALSKLDDEQAKDFKKGGSFGFFALNGIIWQLAEEKFKKSVKSA